MKGGEHRREKENLSRSRNTGNIALGLLLLVLAYFVYPTNNLAAFGVAILGVYMILKR
jgi:hypothetical protein